MRVFLPLLCALAHGPGEARTVGQLTFAPCEIGSRNGRLVAAAECATLDVAENPAKPQGRRLSIALALIPSRALNPNPDPVVVLAGGPGQSARDAYLVASPAFAPILRDRHVLLVDQRGTGLSNPLHCPAPDWKASEPFTLDDARRMAAECRRQLEPRADLRFYTTGDYIRDLEHVRRALGGPPFNLVGGSYGTRVALEYLRRHPGALRSVTLDSVVPPDLAMPGEHAANLDAALSRIAARCKADAACDERFGDTAATLRSLHERLTREPARASFRHPLTHDPVEAPLSGDVLELVVRLFAYSPEMASLLPLLVDEAAHGHADALLSQAEMMASWASESLAHGMELSVICAEDVPRLVPDPDDASTLLGTKLVEATRAQCEEWPRGDVPGDFGEPVRAGLPVLLLSGEFDPVTPPRYAERVARTLPNSRTLIAKGQGHTPMAVGCVPKLLARFVDRLDPQALDASCLDDLGVSPFFLNHAGPAP